MDSTPLLVLCWSNLYLPDKHDSKCIDSRRHDIAGIHVNVVPVDFCCFADCWIDFATATRKSVKQGAPFLVKEKREIIKLDITEIKA